MASFISSARWPRTLGCMKDIDTLESQFKTELIAALRRAAKGRSPRLFSLKEERVRSSARRLRAKAERILELRQSYSVDHRTESPASAYLLTCLKWQHGPTADRSVENLAKRLLRELRGHAT